MIQQPKEIEEEEKEVAVNPKILGLIVSVCVEQIAT